MSAYVPQVGDRVRVGAGEVLWRVTYVSEPSEHRPHVSLAHANGRPYGAPYGKRVRLSEAHRLVLVQAASDAERDRRERELAERVAERERRRELVAAVGRIRAELPVEPQDTPHRVVGVMVDVADLRALLAEVTR